MSNLNLVLHFLDETLDMHFLDEKYGTYIRNTEGVIEHTYYHIGQVSLLRKMIGYNPVKMRLWFTY